MKMRIVQSGFLTIAFAQKSVQNVSPKKHQNLAAAQHLVEQAWQKIVAAQKANEFDMAGHASKSQRFA